MKPARLGAEDGVEVQEVEADAEGRAYLRTCSSAPQNGRKKTGKVQQIHRRVPADFTAHSDALGEGEESSVVGVAVVAQAVVVDDLRARVSVLNRVQGVVPSVWGCRA